MLLLLVENTLYEHEKAKKRKTVGVCRPPSLDDFYTLARHGGSYNGRQVYKTLLFLLNKQQHYYYYYYNFYIIISTNILLYTLN